MGIDRLTAYIIASRDDIVITHGGPAKEGEGKGKYVGWITLGEADRFRPLLNTNPIYDTPEEAEEEMRQTVEELKKIVAEETGGKHPIDHVLSEAGVDDETIDAVKDVIKASKEK